MKNSKIKISQKLVQISAILAKNSSVIKLEIFNLRLFIIHENNHGNGGSST